jgi:hypothetical protein
MRDLIEDRRRCGEGAGCIGGCDSGGVRCGGDLIGGSAAAARAKKASGSRCVKAADYICLWI